MAARFAARPANQVWIGNVPRDLTPERVIQCFRQYNLAEPIYVDIRNGSRSDNYAFAYFKTQAEADAILKLPQDSLFFPNGMYALLKVVVFFVLCAETVKTRPEGLFGPIL